MLIVFLLATYSLFHQEGVDVISWVAGVQIQLVLLDLCPDGCLQRSGAAEDAIVRPWQVFHQCWEGVIQLFGEKKTKDLVCFTWKCFQKGCMLFHNVLNISESCEPVIVSACLTRAQMEPSR